MEGIAVNADSFDLIASDGQRLFARSWRPAQSPVGVVGVVHGIGEHSGRYEHFAQRLTESRLAVYSFDQRGHGRTDGQRGHIDHFDVALNDIQSFVDQMAEAEPTLPRFLVGQSLGGNYVLNFLIRRGSDVTAAVALSPLILPAHDIPSWKRQLGRIMNILRPRFTLRTGLKPEDLTQDVDAVSAYRADPLVHSLVSARLGASMLAAGRWLLANAAQLATPVLLMHGTNDRITSADATRRFAEAAGDVCSLRLWDGLYHELLWETQRDEVIGDIIQWLRRYRATEVE